MAKIGANPARLYLAIFMTMLFILAPTFINRYKNFIRARNQFDGILLLLVPSSIPPVFKTFCWYIVAGVTLLFTVHAADNLLTLKWSKRTNFGQGITNAQTHKLRYGCLSLYLPTVRPAYIQ